MWTSLLKILQHHKFPSRWYTWIEKLLHTGKIVVLLDGCPWPWINCKLGLRQDDPLSHYLFIIVADLLQRLNTNQPVVLRPLKKNLPSNILEYDDDTLIVLLSSLTSASSLKKILDNYAMAIGLQINFQNEQCSSL